MAKSKQSETDYHRGRQVLLRAQSETQVERWKAAAEADRRSLNNWAQGVLDAAAEKVAARLKKGR